MFLYFNEQGRCYKKNQIDRETCTVSILNTAVGRIFKNVLSLCFTALQIFSIVLTAIFIFLLLK